MRGFRVPPEDGRQAQAAQVSIPRRVLRGFRVPLLSCRQRRSAWKMPSFRRFNTPEGVEGFSRVITRPDNSQTSTVGFNTPEGVEGFSSLQRKSINSEPWFADDVSIPRRVLRGFRAPQPFRESRWGTRVSIPRRVLRGFRGKSCHANGNHVRSFQYPGGC